MLDTVVAVGVLGMLAAVGLAGNHCGSPVGVDRPECPHFAHNLR